MTFAQVEAAVRKACEQGDAIGALRLLRDFLQTGPGATDAGRAHTAVAQLFINVGACSMARIRAELAQARELLADSKEHLPVALLTSMCAATADNNEAEAVRWHRAYLDLCRRYPADPAVNCYRGRFTHQLGRLARARGAHELAIKHYLQAIIEYRRFETNKKEAVQCIRTAHAWVAWHLIRLGDLERARQHLDACDGAVFSPDWEAMRACFEVEYHLAVGNLERAHFWLSLGRQWSNPGAEAIVRLQLCQALLARARGNPERALRIGLETRRLAATLKQDIVLPEVRELLRQLAPAGAPLTAGSP